jgi:Sulfotransferase family
MGATGVTLNVYQRARTSLRLRLGRRWVQLRQALSPARPAPARDAPERDDVPIIVAGCHRSGTSLVRRILDSHSRIACPPETFLFEHMGALLSHENAARGLGAIGVTVDDAAAELGALADRWMRDYTARKGKPRWAEKSPGTARQLPAVDRLFGGRAQFVLVVRDGLDVATSLGKGRWSVLGHRLQEHESPYVAAAHYWVDVNEDLRAFRDATPARTHVLSYEALVEDPERALRPLFAFLGEPWEPEVLDFNRFPHDAGVEDHKVSATWKIEDGRGGHRDLPVEEQLQMWDVLGPTSIALGYPPLAVTEDLPRRSHHGR